MANSDTPFGLKPVRHLDGTPWNGPGDAYEVAADYGTALYIGQPVIVTGDSNADGLPQVEAATTGSSNPVTGVITGFEPDPVSLETKYWVASTSTARKVYVAPVRNTIFEIQEDSTGGALTTASVGLNADWTGTSGTAATGISTIELDSSTAATTNTLSLRILRLADRPDNEIGTNAKWWVKFNFPQEDQVLGIG